ncbi:transporter [Scytonema sp. UIC 10036]|uniref:cadmium resistance transporter n=1 Tax=Scytonema sp. UIC 10036 TaxID=2304196 RepID=UPI0012DA5051|nr:cadmium resistance transporter [Scytonema sp. UIC 10036]MUG93400.1 transporter [Scytonema sp. UIC 10036]
MSTFINAVPSGIAAFTATNLDDIVILTLLFSQVNSAFRHRHIVVGQYLGFTVLVAISLLGFFGSFVLPSVWLDVSGFIPIAVGLNRLVNLEEEDTDDELEIPSSRFSPIGSFLSPQTYGVAAITFANGGDNIGIYMPLFASSSTVNLLITISIFFILVAVWCYIAYQLTHQNAIAKILMRYGNLLVPFLLIGLGVYIALDSLVLAILSVAVMFFGWMFFNISRQRVTSA